MTQIDVVTVVLVHWNQAARCVATVEAFRAQEAVDVDMVIVDNGSSPDQLEVLHAIGAVTVIELGRNTGFGPGANAGWRHWLDGGKGEWCVVAPHDALPAPDCLSLMFDALETRPRAGLACADVGDGQTPVIDEYFGGMTSPARVEEGWEPAGYPHGTLLVARRSCLGDIGLFDERYFAYCEEADLGERARRAGWEVGIVRGARVVNPYLGGGSDIVDYLMLRNTLLLVRKHFGRYRATIRFLIALMHLVRGTIDPSSRPWIFAPAARVRALADFGRGRFGPPPATLTRGATTPDRARSTRRSRTHAATRSTRRR
jgi:N-acetylglucosaminyl-diphospho-decaprenol L-rhamnosyltransferase